MFFFVYFSLYDIQKVILRTSKIIILILYLYVYKHFASAPNFYLTLFGVGGKMAPMRVFVKYLKNGSANLYDTL